MIQYNLPICYRTSQFSMSTAAFEKTLSLPVSLDHVTDPELGSVVLF